ncbi:uncharacterized protein EDB91DRAFT_1300485 [Suillus paluster]|uniref:uncharacterized protein n=1 Tax=Suillus paluster TaxID=48578 RepID=UPI001B85B978|nr:uncharacterized protein EDB91DRAFT_1300485 [Suillus paluster]KAG1733367.1 hypothetical protein EDB91DRAFT_1300485 [Suillus paluster]
MYARLFAVASLVTFAVATSGQCNTRNIQCCESSLSVCWRLQLARRNFESHAIVTDFVDIVGIDCSPAAIVGLNSGCEAQQEPLCCSTNINNGLLTLALAALLSTPTFRYPACPWWTVIIWGWKVGRMMSIPLS